MPPTTRGQCDKGPPPKNAKPWRPYGGECCCGQTTRRSPIGIYGFSKTVYTRSITKRLIDIDDTALEQARDLLGGATIKDTVNTALREFSDRDTRMRLFAHIQQLAAEDLGNPDIMKKSRRE